MISAPLQGGLQLPFIGFGTWDISHENTYRAVRTALDVGYRHIDTAYGYHNEDEIGRALADSDVAREDVFLTTKIPSRRIGLEKETAENSLRGLRTDYVDLWLIHDPPQGRASVDLWTFFLGLLDGGQARSIGVSNYSTAQVDELVRETQVTPVVNQIKWAPHLFDQSRIDDSSARSIQLEGFSAVRLTDLEHPTLTEIAQRHGVTTAQVLLRWHIEHGVVALPRSKDPGRIAENLDVFGFELAPDEVVRIDTMGPSGLAVAPPA
jgi:2,5-diketo-D-gluconate reductase A